MTYCVGILLDGALVMASDSRTNAGVDQIALVRKMTLFEAPGERLLVLCSAGNLATTQAVVTLLEQRIAAGHVPNLMGCATLFDAAQLVGDTLREVMARDAAHVAPYGDASASLLLGGQIAGSGCRLFQIYSAGNFIEACCDTPFVQIGETKYGKPILDRMIRFETSIDRAAKCALLSMDATIRSNLSVAPPIDLLCYRADSFGSTGHRRFDREDPYFRDLAVRYADGLNDLFCDLPAPPWLDGGTAA